MQYYTGTWLNDNLLDSAFQLDGLLLFGVDCNHLSGKARGGAYINKGWCTNCTRSSHFSEALEHPTLKCRPQYLPQEFTSVFVMVVYIPSDVYAGRAKMEPHHFTSSLQNTHPEAFHVVAGDFNHMLLTNNFNNKFYQHVTISTAGNNTLGHMYANKCSAYRAVQHPSSLMMVPAYRLLLKYSKPMQRAITVWSSDADSVL